jgi:hypothetical protein
MLHLQVDLSAKIREWDGFGVNYDAFVVLNMADEPRHLPVEVLGTRAAHFDAFRTAEGEAYLQLGATARQQGAIAYDAPPRSVTTFYARGP